MYVAFVDLKEEIYGVKGSYENIKPRTTMELKLTDISNSEFIGVHPGMTTTMLPSLYLYV